MSDTTQPEVVVEPATVKAIDEDSPKPNFASRALSAVTTFTANHPLLVWGGVALAAGAVAVALAPKEKIIEAIEDDSVEITTTVDADGNLVTTIVEANPETSSEEE